MRAYLAGFTSGKVTLCAEDAPADYPALAEFASRDTGKKPILVGVSAGAGLSILAATDPQADTAFAGVVAVGLPARTELGWRWRDDVIYVTHAVPNEPTFVHARHGAALGLRNIPGVDALESAWRLALVLADVSALIAGRYRHIFRK